MNQGEESMTGKYSITIDLSFKEYNKNPVIFPEELEIKTSTPCGCCTVFLVNLENEFKLREQLSDNNLLRLFLSELRTF